jgi:predicted nuclease of predicted toxin-antitoxin system
VRPRFQADADLNQTIVLAVLRQEPGIDFRTAVDAGLEGVPDGEVLALAARAERILVSHDFRTMPRHFANFLQTASSPGVLLVPQSLSTAAAAEEILLIWSVTSAEEWRDRLVFLPL